MSDPINDELDASFISPEREFKGAALAPYTEGSRLILAQVRDTNDSAMFFVWSFVFVHILLAKDRPEALRLAWAKNEFRQKLMEWISDMTIADREAATAITNSILEESAKAVVDVEPSKFTPPSGNG